MDEEQQSMTSASTKDYTCSKQENNTLNAIKTAVTFGSTTKDISKDADSGRQKTGGSPAQRKLSMVSRMYDIDGDGQLGECLIIDCNISLFVHIMC